MGLMFIRWIINVKPLIAQLLLLYILEDGDGEAENCRMMKDLIMKY
jgi:hypothetical protein